MEFKTQGTHWRAQCILRDDTSHYPVQMHRVKRSTSHVLTALFRRPSDLKKTPTKPARLTRPTELAERKRFRQTVWRITSGVLSSPLLTGELSRGQCAHASGFPLGTPSIRPSDRIALSGINVYNWSGRFDRCADTTSVRIQNEQYTTTDLLVYEYEHNWLSSLQSLFDHLMQLHQSPQNHMVKTHAR